MGDAHRPFVKPSDDMIEALDTVPGLSGAGQFVRLAREDDHGGGALHIFERAEELFAAGILRGTEIRLPKDKEHRRVDVLHEGDGGTVGVVLRVFERWGLEPLRLKESEVGGVPPRSPVGDITLGRGRGEAVGVSDGPISEDAAAAAASDTEFFAVDVSALENLIDAGHEIAIVIAGIVILDDVSEVLTVSG